MEGLVVKNTGSWYLVKPDGSEQLMRCKVKGNFRLKGIRTTNPIAVGDRVTVTGPATDDPDAAAFITAVAPRRNYVIRRSSNLSKEAHIIAANVDRAMLVVTLFHPVTSTTFIDRFLASAEAYRIPVTLVINKVDLIATDDEREYLDAVSYLYRSIGYEVLLVSAKTGQGIDALRRRLDGCVTLLSGNSGVGKSTLVNLLVPGVEARTAAISDLHDTGMHTTTFSEMYPLPAPLSGYIIDTPGIKGFGTVDFDRAEVGHFFPEIFEASRECRYSDCTHTCEPGCAVKNAVDDARIALSRYNSYLSILDETADDSKYRKPY